LPNNAPAAFLSRLSVGGLLRDVPSRDENGCNDSIYFDSEAAAQAYVDAVKAVVTAQAAAIMPSQKVLEELDRIGCEAFWKRYGADTD
jgi:hypothetical protein